MSNVKIADRDINNLDKNFALKVKLFMDEVWDKVFITEWYRNQERQDYLYSLWRTLPWKTVTWTKNSEHTKGKAIDIAFLWDEPYPNDIYKWKEISEKAKKYGIDWWYDLWGKDKPHFQDNNKPLDMFLKNSKYWHLIDLNWFLPFDDYKDSSDLKELITIAIQRYDKKRS